MLVYANYIELEGSDAYRGVLSAITGWLYRQTKEKVKPVEISKTNKLNFRNIYISSVVADVSEPLLYSVSIKHPDAKIRGRQWIVEVGISVRGTRTAVSCVLKTDEISSLVISEVITTRPRIIEYISRNEELSSSTPGLKEKCIEDDESSYKALLFEIERESRDYPLVIVSPNRNGKFPVDIDRLQNQLIGLAQVVKLSNNVNSYDLERIVGTRYSAWDGAINILFTPFASGHIRNRLIKSDELDAVLSKRINPHHFILSAVTHNTNVPNLRKHIRSEGVKAKALKEHYLKRIHSDQSPNDNDSDLNELIELYAEQEQEFKNDLDRIELEKLLIEDERDQLQEQITKSEWSIKALKDQLENVGQKSLSHLNTTKLIHFIYRVDDPTPLECIEIIEDLHSEKVIFLESARDSAIKSSTFQRGRHLLQMLHKLIDEYLPAYLESGDVRARTVFTNSQYAANESETVENGELASSRHFSYNGEEIPMWQHLKVGIADDLARTIRVHFSVDQAVNKVIIGYCGQHLPLPNK